MLRLLIILLCLLSPALLAHEGMSMNMPKGPELGASAAFDSHGRLYVVDAAIGHRPIHLVAVGSGGEAAGVGAQIARDQGAGFAAVLDDKDVGRCTCHDGLFSRIRGTMQWNFVSVCFRHGTGNTGQHPETSTKRLP